MSVFLKCKMTSHAIWQGQSRQVNIITTHKFMYRSVCLILVRFEVLKSCCWQVISSWMLFCIGWSIATSVSKNNSSIEMLITPYLSTWHNILEECWCLMLATNPFRMLYFQFHIKELKYMKLNFRCFVCMQNCASLWT